MSLLVTIAWRNLWRNPRRTLILLCSMMVGLVGVLVSIGFTNAWLDEIKTNAIRLSAGHVKVHALGYFDDPVIDRSMDEQTGLRVRLAEDPRVAAWADRVVVQGMLSIAAQSRIVRLVGIDPDVERSVSHVPEAVSEGVFLDAWSGAGQPILIGRKLADRLKKGVGSKVVLMSQQYGSNDLGAAAFRIAGILDSGNAAFDEGHAFVRLEDLRSMLNLGERVTETVVILHDIEDSQAVADTLNDGGGDGAVEAMSWKDQVPLVARTIELSKRMMIPYYAIFYVAMAFGVVNTLLMAVAERTHEIGVLMAIGMRRRGVVGLILLESAVLGMLAAVLGSLVGCGIVAALRVNGIDLSGVADAMEYMSVGRVLVPSLAPVSVGMAAGCTLVVAMVFSIYPALRAARLSPVVAIRGIG